MTKFYLSFLMMSLLQSQFLFSQSETRPRVQMSETQQFHPDVQLIRQENDLFTTYSTLIWFDEHILHDLSRFPLLICVKKKFWNEIVFPQMLSIQRRAAGGAKDLSSTLWRRSNVGPGCLWSWSWLSPAAGEQGGRSRGGQSPGCIWTVLQGNPGQWSDRPGSEGTLLGEVWNYLCTTTTTITRQKQQQLIHTVRASSRTSRVLGL